VKINLLHDWYGLERILEKKGEHAVYIGEGETRRNTESVRKYNLLDMGEKEGEKEKTACGPRPHLKKEINVASAHAQLKGGT